MTFLRARGALAILLLTAVSGGPADAADCPVPPNRIDVEVEASVQLDPQSGLYHYEYDVFSEPASEQEVRRFALDHATPLEALSSPEGWTATSFEGRDTIHWYASENEELPPGTPDTGQVLPGKFQIEPGASLGGFAFDSPKPPGPVTFYALGFAPLPSAQTELEAELLTFECPAVGAGFFELAVTGETLGPVDFIPVTVDIKPGSDPNSLNPRAKGAVPVAVLTTRDFDASTIDPSSLRFGPAEASPVHRGHLEDADGDGDIDLVVHFSVREVGVECGDDSLTLTGTTTDGVPIRGSDTIRTVGGRCR